MNHVIEQTISVVAILSGVNVCPRKTKYDVNSRDIAQPNAGVSLRSIFWAGSEVARNQLCRTRDHIRHDYFHCERILQHQHRIRDEGEEVCHCSEISAATTRCRRGPALELFNKLLKSGGVEVVRVSIGVAMAEIRMFGGIFILSISNVKS